MQIRNQTAGKRAVALILCAVMVVALLPPSAKAAKAAATVSNPRTTDGVSTWDCIYFGNYWQDDTNGDGTANQEDQKQPIKWRVLSVTGDEALVVADQALDCQPYNETYKSVTWETCTLRSWLNSTFLNAAFDTDEKSAIWTTTVVNEDNISFGTEGGNDTSDQIFLLSQNEVKNRGYGFYSDYYAESEARQCKASAYAVENGCWTSSDGYAGNCEWWLRSPGDFARRVAYVTYGGWGTDYKFVDFGRDSVRPALNINLSSSSWNYAGTVSANVEKGSGEAPTASAKPITVPTTKPAASIKPAASAKPTTVPTTKPTASTKPAPAPTTTAQQVPNILPSQTPAEASVLAADRRSSDGKTTGTSLKKVTSFQAKALKKALKLTWKKVSGASGYEIQYSLNKNFKKAKKLTIKKASVKTKTIKRLKKKKKYYIRIRAYTKKGKGAWSTLSKRTKS